jgi:class 3 adenylate cyclase/tetratricopeptide (TPR) repeat protein
MAQRISSPAFVGRVAELATFERLLEQAAAGRGGALMVAGEAGIGKSRLVAELETRARGSDALVLVGECMELAEGELAFAPIVAAMRPVMADRDIIEGLEAPLRSALAALWPSLGEATGTFREQLFEGVYRVLAGLAERQLVILVVEDLHWVDRSSRDLLGFLVHNARRDRLIVVATYRPDELHRGHPLRPFLVELERSGRAERLELEPLTRAELAEQMAAILGSRPPARTIDGIFARSEGNPFFAEELLVSAEPDPASELPGSVREALLLRVELLAPTTKDMLRAAAVVGRSVDHRLLAHVSGAADLELLAALREATEHHVLVLTGHGTAYTFRHALLREAIYDDTLPGERLRLHRAIGKALSASPELATAGATAELAYHWHAAGELPAALGASVQAATEAARMNAYDEGVGHIERALAIWDRVTDAEEIAGMTEVDLLLRGSEVANWAGDPERALTLGERARTAMDADAAPLQAAAAETRIGQALWNAGRGDDAVEHLARARELVPASPPSIERAHALSAEGRALMLISRYSEARRRLEEALEIAASIGSPRVEASVLNSLAIVYSEDGEYARAIASGREGLRIATEFELVEEVMRAYVNGSQAMDNSGRMQDALELGIEGIEAARRLGMERASGDQLRMQAGWRLARMGRFAESESTIQPALEAATTPFNVAGLKSISGHLRAERGEFDVAERLLGEAWDLMQRSGGFQLIGPAIARATSLYLQRGELEKARQRVSDGLARIAGAEPDLIYNAELYWLAVRVEADLARDETAAHDPEHRQRSETHARSVIADLDEAIASIPGDGAPPEATAFRELAGAELTRLLGAHDALPWRRAVERFQALGERLRAAYGEFRAAEALAFAARDEAEIAQPLRRAHATAVEAGAQPFQEQVEMLARRTQVSLGETVASSARPGPVEASRAETDVRSASAVQDVVDRLVGSRRGPRPERLLATVVFTDIVGSTALAADLGDRRWRELLDRHDELVRAAVTRFGGAVVQFIGDGTLSTFDGPGRAIECAWALREAVKPLGIEIRAGVHTGEIELRGDDIGGIAVHIGARVAARADRSEILVSQTVADVVAGSGIQFEPRGAHELKGVPGTWQLSAVLSTGHNAEP